VTSKRPGAKSKNLWMRDREKTMHDLLIALAFFGMIIAPAIVARTSRVEIGDDKK
jgi:hypothetical protein